MALSIATNFIFFFQAIRKVCPREQRKASSRVVLKWIAKVFQEFSFLTSSSSFERWEGKYFFFCSCRQLRHAFDNFLALLTVRSEMSGGGREEEMASV